MNEKITIMFKTALSRDQYKALKDMLKHSYDDNVSTWLREKITEDLKLRKNEDYN